jgi:hypothetical protein
LLVITVQHGSTSLSRQLGGPEIPGFIDNGYAIHIMSAGQGQEKKSASRHQKARTTLAVSLPSTTVITWFAATLGRSTIPLGQVASNFASAYRPKLK